MATVRVTQRLDRAAIAALLVSPRGPVARDLLARGYRVQAQARRNLSGATGSGPKRINFGRLRSSIAVQPTFRNGKPSVRVGSNVFYALYVHDGTGLHGPRHRRIEPTTKKALRFRPKGSSEFVFATSVEGMKPNKFLLRALPAARINPAGRGR